MNNPDRFFQWLGTELDKFILTPIEDNRRLHSGQELVRTAKRLVDELSQEERQQVIAFLSSSNIKQIEDYELPFHQREEYDWIEGVLATIKAF